MPAISSVIMLPIAGMMDNCIFDLNAIRKIAISISKQPEIHMPTAKRNAAFD